jgi:hypothetical protein
MAKIMRLSQPEVEAIISLPEFPRNELSDASSP